MGEFKIDWKTMRDEKAPFPTQAYQFVKDGLAHTVKMIHGERTPGQVDDESQHVSGQQLCLGLRDFADSSIMGRLGTKTRRLARFPGPSPPAPTTSAGSSLR